MSSGKLQGKILIAKPQITSNIFGKSVIYVHESNDTGSYGIMLNIPMSPDLAEPWAEEINWQFPDQIYHGGPVERYLGYVIHTGDYCHITTIPINDYISYTGGAKIVDDINRGVGPREFVLLTGFCAWQPKQLENEIINNMWLVTDFDPDYFFQFTDRDQGWEEAIEIAARNRVSDLLEESN